MPDFTHFSTRAASVKYDASSPIQGDLRIVAAVLTKQLQNIVDQGLTALEQQDEAIASDCYLGAQIITAVTSSIAINLPVELQRAFLEESGQPPEHAEQLLIKMRSEAHRLGKQ